MNEQLWSGVDLKVEYASFHFSEMHRAVAYRQPTAHEIAMTASGNTIVGNDWQRRFYPQFDALLAAARSIPWIIEACFGADNGHREMRDWLDRLDVDERARREKFSEEFRASPHYKTFNKHRHTRARNIILHRTGVAPLEIEISDFFGVVHEGSPVRRIPAATSHPDNPEMPGSHGMPVEPWKDGKFTVDGQPLFEQCADYLHVMQGLIDDARKIAARIHGKSPLSPPP